MKVDVQRQGSVCVVAPRDALAQAAVTELEQLLATETRQAGGRVVLDLTHVPFVDGTGIELLLRFAGNAATGVSPPRLAALSETVREALGLTDTLKRFYLFDSVEAAVRSYV